MTDLTERILAATMLDDLDRPTADRLIDIHLRVVRDLLCPVTGNVLDSRTAHLIYVRVDGHPDPIIAGVVHHSTTEQQLTRRLETAGAKLHERFDPATAWSAIR
jgi:hypothetical protein